MTTYANGYVPHSRLIKIASGTDVNGYWEHLISPSTLRKWNTALDYARTKWGRVMRISTGWNVYRPIDIQREARARAEARGEPNSAARAGWSSHGGTWVSWKYTRGYWVDALAIDVVPQALTWAQVDEAMRHAGFLVGAITKDIAGMNEPWHYIDLDPWAAVPTGFNVENLEEDDMTPEQANKLDAVYAALFGARNLTGKPDPISWVNINGATQQANYGVLPIVIHNQALIATQAGRLAAMETVVEQLAEANGAVLDMAAIEQAAERGAKTALTGLTITLETS